MCLAWLLDKRFPGGFWIEAASGIVHQGVTALRNQLQLVLGGAVGERAYAHSGGEIRSIQPEKLTRCAEASLMMW